MIQLLKTFKKRLTNLTSGNRSLLLLQPYKRQFLDLQLLDFADNKLAFSIIEQLLSGGKKITLCSHIDPRDGKTNELGQHLKLIHKTNEMLQAERGAEDLYVGYPIAKGKLIDGSLIRCPLMFFPVELGLENNSWKLSKRENPTFLNRSFLLAYSHFNEIKIDDELLDTNLDELNSDPKVFLTELYELLKKSELEINFNSDLFQKKLEPFKSFKKADFEEIKNGEMKLFSEAVLGIFPQTGSYISADYDELLNNGFAEKYETLEAYLSKHEEIKSEVKEEHLRLPLSVDASQEEAIRLIKSGKSMVIQGPPGTGKSQMICNLMADYASEGKRVLLVCQKRAAIDTVYKRLSQVGMQPFAGLVHDFKSDQRGLYEKLSRQIENILAYKHENQSLNAIFLEREFDAVCRKIDKITNELEHFKQVLFDDSKYGKSVKELYLMANQNKNKSLDLSKQFSFFHFSNLDEFLDDLNTLEKYKDQFETGTPASDFWKNRKDFNSYSISELQKIKVALIELAETKTRLKAIHAPFSMKNEHELQFIEQYEKMIKTPDLFHHFYTAFSTPNYLKIRQDFEKEIESFQFTDAAYTLQQPEKQLEVVQAVAEKNKNILGSLSLKWLSKDKNEIFSLLDTFGYPQDYEHTPELAKSIKELIRLRNIANEIGHQASNVHLDDVRSLLNAQISSALLWEEFGSKYPFIQNHLTEAGKSQFDAFISERKSILLFIRKQHDIWESILENTQIKEIDAENLNQIISFLDSEFHNIQARDVLYANLSEIQKYCYNHTAEVFPSEYALHFKENLILHFIEDLELKNPALRNVSSMQMEFLEEELQELVLKKRKFSKDHLLLKLREHTYKNIEKNRLGNPTTYRELQHQVSKKKQVWPVRKLIEEFHHELFDLMPCWMASPETVSAIFPLEKEPLFDLVIFDEASQCYAENGLPAMLRGKQIAIAGDSKQLQPNDLYRIRFEEEKEEDDVLLEVESLLELSTQFMPQCMLRGHYRSQSLDLIDFSNTVFYKNSLKLLPDFKELNEGRPSIDFIKVDGIWDKNTNQKEAERIVELVRLIRSAKSTKSIGIVTFNFQQAELISELMGEINDVTIKNIENIQGDEFDMVIFSIGYAPGKDGKIKMNFGSLSQKGGENRLNVAITRAREEIIVVCSLLPEMLHTENSVNAGPKLLKEYLQYAKNVADKIFVPTPAKVAPHAWSKQLKNEYLDKADRLTDELPFADLAEKEGSQYGRILFTDDELFYSAESIKESFAYTPLTLKEKGWEYYRTWSRNWWQNTKIPPLLSEEKPKTE